jgi:hypothetical protein
MAPPMTGILRLVVCVLAIAAAPAHAQPEQMWLGLLRQGDFNLLEEQTIAFHRRFAANQETEFTARQAYRPLYNLTEQDLLKLDEWQKAHPRSYSARLIRGTYYKRAGFSARGSDVASRTPPEKFAAMRRLYALALPPLQESLSLTEKPYLSIFHMLDMLDRPARKALLDQATSMLPSNTLVRARYMRGLTPRWGGSHEAMWAFLSEARSTGATEMGLAELEAIIHDDLGDIAIRQGDVKAAVDSFRKALDLGAKAGGEVPQELRYSRFYRCTLPGLKSYC